MAKKARPSSGRSNKKRRSPPAPTPRRKNAADSVPGLPLMCLYRYREGEMSQEELGDKVGVSQGMISQWEGAESDVPLGMVHALAAALHTTAYALQFVNPLDEDQSVFEVWSQVPPQHRARALRFLKDFTT